MQHTEKELNAAENFATSVKSLDKVFNAPLDHEDIRLAHLAGQTYAKSTQWIRVDSGELPEKEEINNNLSIDVLIFFNGVVDNGMIERAYLQYDTMQWFVCAYNETICSDDYEVTHWQPLPTPPTE